MTATWATARASDGRRRRRPSCIRWSAATLAAATVFLQVNHYHTASAQHDATENGASRSPSWSGAGTSDDAGHAYGAAAPAHYEEEAGVFDPANGGDVDDRTLLDCFGEAAKEVLTRHVIPPTDAECRWSWKHLRCEPYCNCHLHHLWGDYHVGRSCRLLRRISSGPAAGRGDGRRNDDGGNGKVEADGHDREWEEDDDRDDEFCHLPPDTRYVRTIRSILDGTEEVVDTTRAAYLYVRGLAGVVRDDTGRRLGMARDDAGRRLREVRERACDLARGGGGRGMMDSDEGSSSPPGGKNVVRRKLRELFRCEPSSDAGSDEEEFETASFAEDDEDVAPPDGGAVASVGRDEDVSAGQGANSPIGQADEASTMEENVTHREMPDEAIANESEAGAPAEQDEVTPVDNVEEGIPVLEVIEPIDEAFESEEGAVQATDEAETGIPMKHGEEEGLHREEADYTAPEVKVPSEMTDSGQNEVTDPSPDVDTDSALDPETDRRSRASSGGKAFFG